MLFNSVQFVVFLLVVLILMRLVSAWRARKAVLLIASYLFYAAWNPPFVILLWMSTVVDWMAARRIHAAQSVASRRAWLGVSLAVNLGLLAYFKYGVFAIETINQVLGTLGVQWVCGQPSIILPVGISFYTFQTLSYTLDIYRGKSSPWHSALDYALYVTFFPQLVAGPIVRATDFLHQCNAPRRGTARQLGWGLSLFVIGLFSKVVVADSFCAPVVEAVFDQSAGVTFVSAWVATIAFAIQIFCDFSGYSTCAIGVAMCLGFDLPDNFRFPYASLGFSDFWQRWHISLSSWLRDYLYIPLGGSHAGALRTVLSLMVTMLLGGLWHGASWMFLLWGGLHGLFLVAERLVRRSPVARWSLWQTPCGRGCISLITFALVCLAWVLFRAHSIGRAGAFLRAMLWPGGGHADAPTVWGAGGAWVLAMACAVLIVHHALRNSSIEHAFGRLHWSCRSLVLAVMLHAVLISMTGESVAFIYFQF